MVNGILLLHTARVLRKQKPHLQHLNQRRPCQWLPMPPARPPVPAPLPALIHRHEAVPGAQLLCQDPRLSPQQLLAQLQTAAASGRSRCSVPARGQSPAGSRVCSRPVAEASCDSTASSVRALAGTQLRRQGCDRVASQYQGSGAGRRLGFPKAPAVQPSCGSP